MKEKESGKPKDKTPEELQTLVDAYFQSCRGSPLYDGEGNPVLDKQGAPIMVGACPPTVSGLALALGFTGRKELLCRRGKKKYRQTIERAKLRVEEYCESQLFDKDRRQGAEFALRFNFQWGQETDEDKKKTEDSSGGVILMPEIQRPDGQDRPPEREGTEE